MTNLETAQSLAASGIPVFPCEPAGEGRKRPKPGVMWAAQASTRPADVARLWSRFPDAAPGIKIEATPFLVVDCDPPHGAGQQHGIEWFRSACMSNDFDIETVPIVQTPSGGWHVYFRRPAGMRLGNGRGALPPKAQCGIDIRGAGGYVIGPGAEMDVGRYELLEGPEVSAAPEMPDWLAEILTSKRAADVVAPALPAVQRGAVTGREEAYAQAGLDAECAAIAGTPPGGRNNALNDGAFKLGTMVGAGWIGHAEVRAALVNAVAGWKDARKTLGTLDRALRDGMAHPRGPLEPEEGAEAAERRNALAADLEAIAGRADFVADAEPAAPAAETQEFPDEWLQPPGLVGEIADWIMATSMKPVRLFAVASALTTVGALVARQVYSGTPRTGTQLYMLMIAGTGGGKDWPLRAVGQILAAVDRNQMRKASFSSSAALTMRLAECPAHVHIIDEIAGTVLRRLNNTRSSNAENSILDIYRELWGIGTRDFVPESTTMRTADAITRPWVSILGATNPDEFHEQLKSKAVSNGFLNRFLVLPKITRVGRNPAPEPADEVPADIVERCKALMKFDDDRHKFPQSANYSSNQTPPELVVIDADEEARAMLERVAARQDEIEMELDENPLMAVWVRYAEMVRRVALVVACGRHPTSMVACRITVGDVEFADRLVSWSMSGFVRELSQNMADTQHQADMLHVLGIVRKARTIKRMDLYRRLNGRFNKMTMESIIDALKTSGALEEQKAASSGGRQAIIYQYIQG